MLAIYTMRNCQTRSKNSQMMSKRGNIRRSRNRPRRIDSSPRTSIWRMVSCQWIKMIVLMPRINQVPAITKINGLIRRGKVKDRCFRRVDSRIRGSSLASIETRMRLFLFIRPTLHPRWFTSSSSSHSNSSNSSNQLKEINKFISNSRI